MTENKTIWYSSEKKSYFLITAGYGFLPGNDELEEMSGTKIHTDIKTLSAYNYTEQQAKEYLQRQWNETIEASKTAWSHLNRFSELSGRGYDINNLKKSFMDGLAREGPEVNQAFNTGKAAVEALLKAVEHGNPASNEEEKEVFKKIFQQKPGLGNLLSEEELEKAAADPDAWAEKLHEQFITPAEKLKLKEREEKLAAEIRESIAEGLRKAGINPAGSK